MIIWDCCCISVNIFWKICICSCCCFILYLIFPVFSVSRQGSLKLCISFPLLWHYRLSFCYFALFLQPQLLFLPSPLLLFERHSNLYRLLVNRMLPNPHTVAVKLLTAPAKNSASIFTFKFLNAWAFKFSYVWRGSMWTKRLNAWIFHWSKIRPVPRERSLRELTEQSSWYSCRLQPWPVWWRRKKTCFFSKIRS